MNWRLFPLRLAVVAILICVGNDARAVDCSEKILRNVGRAHEGYAELDHIIGRLKDENPQALENGTGKFILVRRYVSGGSATRGGEISAQLPLTSVSKGLTINYRGQKINDFSIDSAFSNVDLSTIIRVRRSICGTSAFCGSFPKGEELDRFLADLVACNGKKQGVFEFDDAFVALDMTWVGSLAIGEGVVIQKKQGKLWPQIIIISQ